MPLQSAVLVAVSIELALTFLSGYVVFMNKEYLMLLAQFAELFACGCVFYAVSYGREGLLFVYLVYNVSIDEGDPIEIPIPVTATMMSL